MVKKSKLIPRSKLVTFEVPMRLNQDSKADKELLEDIRENGIEERLLVRPTKEGLYEIIDGHRRYNATGKLGWVDEQLPCEIRELADEEAYMLSIRVNVLRAAVSPRSMGNYLLYTRTKFGLSQQALAKKVGKTQSWVSRMEKFFQDGISVPASANERQARAFRSVPPHIKKEIMDKSKLSGKLPTAEEIIKRAEDNMQNVLILLDYSRHDVEFAKHLFQTEGGFKEDEALELAKKWDTRGFETLKKKEKVVDRRASSTRAFEELIKWYPSSVVDIVAEQTKSTNLETLRKWCKIYLNTMHTKASTTLRQTILEVFIR